MAQTKATAKYVRVSPPKVRQLTGLIAGEHVEEARRILQFSGKGAANPLTKVLNSAVANAENNDGIDPDDLWVVAAFADEGPTLKRWRPRAHGRAYRIRKRTSHITVVVGTRDDEQDDRGRRSDGDRAARQRRVSATTTAPDEIAPDEIEPDETEPTPADEADASAPEEH